MASLSNVLGKANDFIGGEKFDKPTSSKRSEGDNKEKEKEKEKEKSNKDK